MKNFLNNIKFFKFILICINLSFLYPQENTVGLIRHDENQTQSGYTLFQHRNGKDVYLINNNGHVVNKWETDYKPSATVYLLEDGNILRATKLIDPNGGTGGFQVLDWDSNIIWEYTYGPQHHDIEPMPNGNVLLITNETIDSTTAVANGRDSSLIKDDLLSLRILEISNNNNVGEIVWEWSAWDHIIQEFDQTKPNYGDVSEHPELINLNYVPNIDSKWIHPNSIDYNEDFDQIIISARSYNELWVIDHSENSNGNLIYRWGNPEAYGLGDAEDQFLFGQHDARWVESGLPGAGNIMAFNNGLDRPAGLYSTIIEIIPPVDELGNYSITEEQPYEPSNLTWLYTATNPEDFYSSVFSGAHRLTNGNTLISSGRQGRIFEVTTNGEIVWEFINPLMTNGVLAQGDEPTDNAIFRAHKYSTDFIISLGVDTTSQGPIELYNVAVEDESNGIFAFRLKQNHPNPFNPNTSIEFELAEASYTTLTIYDIAGNEIRTLLNRRMESGVKNISWDSLDNDGNPVSSGMYFYTVTAGETKQTKKMLLLR